MLKPDLNRMWETFMMIPTEDGRLRLSLLYDHIRLKVYPMIARLQNKDMIDWYCLLIHNRKSGVPTSEDDDNAYFHIRFSLGRNVDPNEFLASLPNHCVLTRKINRERVESISGLDKSLLKNEDIEEAWRIIGEQSEWFLNMLNIHKGDADIPPKQIAQFLHFYANMSQLPVG